MRTIGAVLLLLCGAAQADGRIVMPPKGDIPMGEFQ